MFQPLGVVGIVVPWNYPIYLAIGPAICALAAGNRILVKMSEAAPATGEFAGGDGGGVYIGGGALALVIIVLLLVIIL